jgi:hypothetical protein
MGLGYTHDLDFNAEIILSIAILVSAIANLITAFKAPKK